MTAVIQVGGTYAGCTPCGLLLLCFLQAGLPQTLDTALREGWVPKGALKTVALLHRRLS